MKMMMKVELVSRETIKPSSPTPPHLKTFNLSLVDQFTADIYIPFILFYSPNQHTNDQNTLLDQLMKSLSETLTLYYPLAGILKDNNKIICDDSGIEILHARIGCHLSDVLNHSEPQHLVQFVPYTVHQHNEKTLLVVKFNVFECGGIAIGVCVSHKAMDSTGLCAFLTTWASINAQGGLAEEVPEDMRPKFDIATCFPAKAVPSAMHVLKTKGKIVTKRYIFDASMIASLRSKATSTTIANNPNSKGPSRVLSVIALLWKVGMAVDRHKHGLTPRTSYMAVAASMRSKIDLPMPYLSFGNLVVIAPAIAYNQNDNLLEKLGQAVRKVDRDFVTKLQSGNEYLEYMMYLAGGEQQFLRGEAGRYAVTSWCRFPFYEIDFGWGKPIWANVPSFEDKNFLILMDTKVGEGIEAWVSLDEEDMAIFESQPEIQAFFN
ncbi:hypothetical protein Scep_015099 [Stephania cephalantha]|uniref:Uncharacterized protein n=1 Tax=Stephania cephalantha TaxID=152367 RepID=A0AAP0J2N4_9MAGN